MRIIAGKYRGRVLKSPPSLQVRPTSDRLRETLFNVLAPWVAGVGFLDLCAGSGAVGIEALSRGVAHATFVDRSRKMCGLIETNLDLLSVPEDQTNVIQAEAADFLRRCITKPRRSKDERRSWDLIFFDPPYVTDYETVLNLLDTSEQELLSEGGLLIVEHHHKKFLMDQGKRLIRTRVLKQGDSTLSFYQKQSR